LLKQLGKKDGYLSGIWHTLNVSIISENTHIKIKITYLAAFATGLASDNSSIFNILVIYLVHKTLKNAHKQQHAAVVLTMINVKKLTV